MAVEDEFGSDYSGHTSCGQMDAERNHDNLNRRSSWDEYYEDLDGFSSESHCEDFAQTYQPQFRDNADKKFVQFIFDNGGSQDNAKKTVFNLGLQAPYEISYKGQAWNPNNDDELIYDTFTGSIYSFYNCNVNKWKKEVVKCIKNYLGGGEGRSAFLFVDVGVNFLDGLNNVMTKKDPIFHVIMSAASFADSATEGKELYDTSYFRKQIHGWWYQQDLTVPVYNTAYGEVPDTPYNYMFLSGSRCALVSASDDANDPTIEQYWYNGDDETDTAMYIPDATDQNNKSGVNTDFDNAPDSDYRSLCYHRKRSGDGFAIWFMEQFASIILEDGDEDFWHTCGWGITDPDDVDGYGLLDDLDYITDSTGNYDFFDIKCEIRAQSFFVTHDWPAFCWAAYCHCNVIHYNKNLNKGSVIIFIADQNGICY
jgi:hypothetical protein